MNKAKIFLTALTVMTVVSGALAYKAKTIKIFGFCATIVLKCTLNTFQTFQKTTAVGGTKVSYDEADKPCVFDPAIGTYTCTTIVTISI